MADAIGSETVADVSRLYRELAGEDSYYTQGFGQTLMGYECSINMLMSRGAIQ